jgi:predicted transcriptional regulator
MRLFDTTSMPKPMRRRRRDMQRISALVPRDLKLMLMVLADRRNTSISVLLREAVVEYVARHRYTL